MGSKARDKEGSPATISRRQSLKLMAGGIGVLAGASSGLARAQAPAKPRAGGVLKVARLGTPKVIDPALAILAEEFMITQNIYDNLTRLDEKLQAQPQLATEWHSNPNGDIWTF